MEEFRDIIGYEGMYQVSNYGRVKSLMFNKEKLLKPTLRAGYKILVLCKNTHRKSFSVHQLVAMAFLGHQPDGTMNKVIDHINNNKSDNRLRNLQITTNRENCSKDVKNKTSKYIGVCWCKSRSKWRTTIKINGKQKHLGYFTCEFKAYQSYQNKLKTL